MAPRRKLGQESQAHIKSLASGIGRFGFNVPIAVDNELGVNSGHARLAAAKLLRLKTVSVIRIELLTEEQIRLFVIFDDKIAEGGE